MAPSLDTDIIIVGAGTAGLVLAHELSKDPTLQVHVFEAGKDCGGHPDLQDVSKYTVNLGTDRDWHFESVPQPGLNGRTATQNAGKLLGGSSAMNGGYYVAPSSVGVNAWAKLGNVTWSYNDVERACLETIQSHLPPQQLCRDMGLDDFSGATDSKPGNGPVQVTAQLEGHPVTEAYFRALRDLGYQTTSAIFSHTSTIGQPLFLTQDVSTGIRSDASNAFGTVLKDRSNVTLYLDTTVKRVMLEGTPPYVSAKGVEVVTSNGQSRTFFASKEVILSAGALNTPKLLELSGVGLPSLLQKHQIPVVVQNPYVGERLRNHIMSAVHCELNDDIPATTPGLKAMAYMSSKDQPGLIEALRNYASQPGDDDVYDNEVKRIFLDPKEGSCCHFMGFLGMPNAYTFGVISAIPFSKGNTHITSADPGDKPTVDPCFYTHPLDLEVMAHHFKTAAGFASQPALKPFFKINDNGNPVGADMVAGSNVEKIKEYLRESSVTTYHACGTASMRPRDDGGVVDEQLKVYDTVNLRVVDASVIPLIAHGNPMATVYGVAKRAADMIKQSVNSN